MLAHLGCLDATTSNSFVCLALHSSILQVGQQQRSDLVARSEKPLPEVHPWCLALPFYILGQKCMPVPTPRNLSEGGSSS